MHLFLIELIHMNFFTSRLDGHLCGLLVLGGLSDVAQLLINKGASIDVTDESKLTY